MYDLRNLDKWVPIGKEAIRFKNKTERKVRLEVLSHGTTELFVKEATSKRPFYIGTFSGYDVVQFAVEGEFLLTSSGQGNACVFSPEFDSFGMVEIPEQVSFTKIVLRKQRNPELELMMKRIGDNMERRIRQVTNDMQLARAADMREAQKENDKLRREAAKAAEDRLTERSRALAQSGGEDENSSAAEAGGDDVSRGAAKPARQAAGGK